MSELEYKRLSGRTWLVRIDRGSLVAYHLGTLVQYKARGLPPPM